MMTLTLNRASAKPTLGSRRSTVVVRAGPLQGLMNIFKPMEDKNDMNKVDWTGTGTGYKGNISRGRKPFKDGYTAQKSSKGQAATRQPVVEKDVSIMGYLNAAVTRVVSNNFKGDATEPDWSKMGSKGWSGDVKRRRGN